MKKIGPRELWLVVNGENQPIYLTKDRKLWVFRTKEDAQWYIDSPTRDVDRREDKVRRIVEIIINVEEE